MIKFLIEFIIGITLIVGIIWLFLHYIDVACFIEWINEFKGCLK
jgi:hypothetical protein